MPSRLSSLLVRDGVVGVKVLERAFQRQVIYGGALDTNLLEMKAATEDQLLQYASLATGVPPATRSDLEKLDPDIVETCPESLARQYHIAPLAMIRGELLVLVSDPIDLGALESLADELDVAIQPLLVLEYRFQVARGRLYDLEVDARFAKVAARLAREASPSVPAMRPESVVVNSPAHARSTDEPRRRRPRRRPTSKPPAEKREVAPVAATATAAESPQVERAPEPALAKAEMPAVAAEGATEATAATDAEATAQALGDDTAAADTAHAPIAPDDARLLLEKASHRDDVFLILLRALRSQTSYAGLLTVQGAAAIGRVAIADDPALAEPVRDVLIPLDVASPFRKAVESGAPYIGPVGTGDAEVDSMIERLGGCVPPAALLLPISLRNRVVAVAFGHRGNEAIGISEVAGILPVAGAAADALHRVIMSRKAAGKRGGGGQGVPEPISDEPPTSRIPAARGDDAAPQPAATADTVPAETAESEAAGDDGIPPLDALLAATSRGDADGVRRARERALAAPWATAKELSGRFPGPLELDRHSLGGELRPASDHGPILDLIVHLGSAADEIIIKELQSDEPAHRYYAALCAGAVQPTSAVSPLVDCLFDADPGVRAAAVEALASYRRAERDGALSRVREVLTEIDEARVGAAATACAGLGHAAAIPALIEALSRETAPDPVRRALVSLTKQDFGGSSRKWRSWWSKNRDKSRIEWMIDGLAHKDADVRRSSIEELRRITGEYFGYHHDLPRKERNEAHKRWTRWWQETDRKKVTTRAEERRSTRLIPAELRD